MHKYRKAWKYTICKHRWSVTRPNQTAPDILSQGTDAIQADHMCPPFPTLWSHVFPVSFSMSFISYMSFPRVSIIVILDSGFAYIQVCKAKFACDWAYHAPTSKYVSYEGFFLSLRILFSALWRWKGDHVVDPLGKSWQHTSASTGGSEPAFNSFMLFSKIFYIHEALVEPSLNSLIIVT